MTEDWFSCLPEQIRSQGVCLIEFGVNGTAWPACCTEEIFASLRGAKYAVLGGDIYRMTIGRFTSTGENWACEIQRGEPWLSYVERSCIDAEQFLVGIARMSDTWFTVIATRKPSARQLATSHAR